MTTLTKVPIDIVAVDAGPLITLSIAGELDLLKRFRRPIRILDVAKSECTRFRDKPGANELAAWFGEAEGRDYSTIKTPDHQRRYLEATAKEDAGDTGRPSEGIGDEAITWYLANVAKIERGPNAVLVLLEDAPFGDGSLIMQNPEVAVLSTRAFLRTLQNYGLVESAEAIIKRVEENSRRITQDRAYFSGGGMSGGPP